MNLPYTPQYYARQVMALIEKIDNMDPEERDRIANGCGPKGAAIDLVDDTPFGAEFNTPCGYHDVGYEVGINDEDKTIADLMFLFLMVLSIIYSDDPDEQKAIQLNIAMKYFAAVYFLGGKAFYAD